MAFSVVLKVRAPCPSDFRMQHVAFDKMKKEQTGGNIAATHLYGRKAHFADVVFPSEAKSPSGLKHAAWGTRRREEQHPGLLQGLLSRTRHQPHGNLTQQLPGGIWTPP